MAKRVPLEILDLKDQRYSCHGCGDCCRDFSVQLRDEDLDRLSNAEIAVFFEEHFPEALDDINEASEAEDEEHEHELRQAARELVGEFYLLFEDIGREAAEAFMSIHRNELIADRIVGELRDGEEEGEEALHRGGDAEHFPRVKVAKLRAEVRGARLALLVAHVERADPAGAVELVRGEAQIVAPQLLHIDTHLPRRLHGVDVEEPAG